jgi:hypothetical protein
MDTIARGGQGLVVGRPMKAAALRVRMRHDFVFVVDAE